MRKRNRTIFIGKPVSVSKTHQALIAVFIVTFLITKDIVIALFVSLISFPCIEWYRRKNAWKEGKSPGLIKQIQEKIKTDIKE